MISVEFKFGLGAPVTITAIGLTGIVTGQLNNLNGRQYQVAWWTNNERRCEGLFESEIQ